jgi:hypothetical protein
MSDLISAGMDLLSGLLAEPAPRDIGPDFGKASPFGLIIVVLLLIGTFLLVWSMNRHLKKLPASFDRDNPGPDQALDEGTVDVDSDSTPENGSSPREPDR